MREHDRSSAPAWCYLDPATMVTGVASEATDVPARFVLHGSYPNPFNPAAVVSYSLFRGGHAVLEVYDLLGRTVRAIDAGQQGPGRHEIRLEAVGLSSGVYIYRLRVVDSQTRASLGSGFGKLVLTK